MIFDLQIKPAPSRPARPPARPGPRRDAKFKAKAQAEETRVELSNVTLEGNQLVASFNLQPSSLAYASVAAVWTGAGFEQLRIDHI